MEKSLSDVLWVTISAALVFIMQGGFLCLEAGLTRSKNSINVAIKNLTDFGISILFYWAFGFALMFGFTKHGWIGTSHFFVTLDQEHMWLNTFFLYQVMFCGTAVTIVSGGAAERLRFGGYIIIAVLVSGIIYPLFGHWAWGGAYEGGMGWLASRGFVDFAGSSVVHSVGGWVTLAAVIVIGARTGRFTQKEGAKKIPNSNLPQAMLGVLLLWFGWIGFNGGSTLALNDQVPGIVTRTMLAGGAGMITTLFIGWQLARYPDPLLVMNGSLAGLVAITANVHAVNALEAIVIGTIGGVVMLIAERLLEQFHIDDVVGAFPVHGAAGIWGTLAVGIFGNLEVLGTGLSRPEQIMTQLLGIVVCAAVSFGIAFIVLILINRRAYPLRVSPDDEYRGLNVSEHRATTETYDLFKTLETQQKTKDLSIRVPVEPFTMVGQIAQRFNDVMDSLQESIETTEAIVRTAKDAVVTFFQKGSAVASFNPSAEFIFGYPAHEVIGRSVEKLLSEKQDAFDLLRKAIDTPVAGVPQRILGHRADGSEFPMEVSVSKAHSNKGEFYTAVFRDVTERENMLKQRQSLEGQLRQSQKLESIGTMANGIAHNFNNILGAIRGFIDMASADIPTGSRSRKDLQKALRGIEDAKELSNQMLLFSRKGKQKLKRIAIYPVIKEAVEFFSASVSGAVDIHLKVDTKDSTVFADQNEIKQVVMNLCTNAHHAMLKTGGSLEINLNEVSVDVNMTKKYPKLKIGKYALITITDTGHGMDQKTMARIFEPFFTTKEPGKGTGLGLSVIHGIITGHKGEITVDSAPGKGTVFKIYLPKIKDEPQKRTA